MRKYKAIIIGAGQIGAFYDNPNSKEILTHAHAFEKHPGINLVGFVDIDIKKAQKAAKVWQTNYFSSIDEAIGKENVVDIVSVCVPDEFHYQVIKDLSKMPVKLILTEKPITSSLVTAKEIIELCKKSKISLAVNYSRRYLPEYIIIKKKIEQGKYGKFVTGTGFYGKGIVHNGSHMIDLIRYLISDIVSATLISKENDFYPKDPSVSALLKLENKAHISLLSLNCGYFTIFELDLLFEKGRIRITDSGNYIEEYNTISSKIFNNYKYLSNLNKINTSLNQSVYFAIDNIYRHLVSEQKLICDGNEAFSNLKAAITIKQSRIK